MFKEILLLTKSKKHNGLCVTGIDTSDNRWIRLMIEGDSSIPEKAFKYIDGSTPELLDTIIVDILNECGTDLHPEDVYFDHTNIVKRNKDYSNLLIDRIEADSHLHPYVFYNQQPRLSCLDVSKMKLAYSLIAVAPEDIYFMRDESRTLAYFRYKNKLYLNFRVTDKTLKSELSSYPLNKIIRLNRKMYLIISLGEQYGGYYYKLVAAAIDADKVTMPIETIEIDYDEVSTIGNLYNKYKDVLDTPLVVHKSTWTDDYCLVIEGIKGNSIYGTTYKGGRPHSTAWRKIDENQFSMYRGNPFDL